MTIPIHATESATFAPISSGTLAAVTDATRPLWALLCVPAVVLSVAAITDNSWVQHTDFAAYYYTALAWRTGVQASTLLPMQPSLSPPTLSLILWPLTCVPLIAAFCGWLLVNLAAVIGTFRVMQHRGLLTPKTTAWLVLATIVTQPAFMTWWQGQLGWIVGYAVTRAWVAGSAWRSGAWLALGIAVKPPLALMALALPVTVTVSAAGVAGTITLLAIGLTGWPVWRDWLALSGSVWWLDLHYNMSFWGIPARLQAGHPRLSELTPAGWGIALGLIAPLYVACWRERGDRRWVFAGIFGILASPLGWVHYMTSLLAPLSATWPASSRWSVVAVALLGCPAAVMLALVPVGIGTWIYPLGALGLLLAYLAMD